MRMTNMISNPHCNPSDDLISHVIHHHSCPAAIAHATSLEVPPAGMVATLRGYKPHCVFWIGCARDSLRVASPPLGYIPAMPATKPQVRGLIRRIGAGGIRLFSLEMAPKSPDRRTVGRFLVRSERKRWGYRQIPSKNGGVCSK